MSKLSKLNNRTFLLLGSLGIISLLFLGILSSYLAVAPIAKFIRECTQLITLSPVYRGVGLLAGIFFLLWLKHVIGFCIHQKRVFQSFRKGIARKEELPEGLKETAEEIGVLNKLLFVTETNPIAFTFGLFKPKIVISDCLVEMLELKELKAVLFHEKCHVMKKDPFKIFLLRALFNKVSSLGLITRLMQDFSVTMELQADKYAQRILGVEQQFLASALLKLIKFEVTPPRFAVGVTSVLEARIEHCLNHDWLPKLTLKPQDWTILGGYVAFLLVVVYMTITYNQSFVSVSCHPTYLCHLTYL
ncbi:M56 family metallopeptidase [Desulfitobacterium sp.]|uniref:M56 family metallopeptidase n=1 Tax=Desulfitobacterium sp. TaxID=49981 RepID=UPI002B7D3E2F|nr:M56 family metallopeptidase [Desulfitobacterium sp.]HVJ47677.1 M56 family metallopeptidase [Desulfitobacterium sp.]